MQDARRPLLWSLMACLPLALLAPGSLAQTASGTQGLALACQPATCALAPVGLDAERMRVETRDGKTLTGDFYVLPRKKGSEERSPAALLIHSPGSDRVAFATLADALARAGMAVLTIDLRGHGESADEETNWGKLDAAGQANLWTFAVRDLEAAVAWLRARPEVHTTALHLFGFGAGAGLAAHYALGDEAVRSLTLIEPFLGPAFEAPTFDLPADLAELEGLPMRMLVERSHKPAVDALLTELDAAEWIEVELSKPVEGGLLSDKRLTKACALWAEQKNAVQAGDALGTVGRG